MANQKGGRGKGLRKSREREVSLYVTASTRALARELAAKYGDEEGGFVSIHHAIRRAVEVELGGGGARWDPVLWIYCPQCGAKTAKCRTPEGECDECGYFIGKLDE